MKKYFSDEDLLKFGTFPFLFIKTEQIGQVFYIKLNRPEKRNAFTPTMVAEIAFSLAYSIHNQSIWCVVIEAEGHVFCAGMDLNVYQNPSLDTTNPQLPKPLQNITLGDCFNNFYKPTIAVVRGDVYAGGFLIITGCTFTLALENLNFGLPEVKRGIFPLQVMAALSKFMPQNKILQLSILGENINSEQALALGLVYRVSKREEIDKDLESLINKILLGSPFAIQKGIEVAHLLESIEKDQQHEFLFKTLNEIRDSEDAKEGIAAFKEKRKPNWKNC